MPVGQLCGRLMERRTKLRAYGLNLLGSLLGVVLMLVASLLWTPPLVWFALCFLAMLLFPLRSACFDHWRRFLHGGVHRGVSMASESSLEPGLLALSIAGDWRRSRHRPNLDTRRRPLLSAHLRLFQSQPLSVADQGPQLL